MESLATDVSPAPTLSFRMFLMVFSELLSMAPVALPPVSMTVSPLEPLAHVAARVMVWPFGTGNT